MTSLERRLASVARMEESAARRVPRFAFSYMQGGIDREVCLAANRRAIQEVRLVPRALLAGDLEPDPGCDLIGRSWPVPFAPAPLGLSGLIWPGASRLIAEAAVRRSMPVALSSFATSSVEEIGAVAGTNLWFQLYCTADPAIENDIIDRAEAAGAGVLIITVDVPTRTRRERDIESGLSVPPRFALRTLMDIAARPAWALAVARAGIPRFGTLERYLPKGLSWEERGRRLSAMVDGRVTTAKLERLRARWKGPMIVKGILAAADALKAREIGIDAVVVSNHGGRQFDAAPPAAHVLPGIRRAVGDDYPLLADGGVRSGIDIARMLACGADFVLMGRTFACAVAAAGTAGVDHAIAILRADLRQAMVQAGVTRPADLRKQRLTSCPPSTSTPAT